MVPNLLFDSMQLKLRDAVGPFMGWIGPCIAYEILIVLNGAKFVVWLQLKLWDAVGTYLGWIDSLPSHVDSWFLAGCVWEVIGRLMMKHGWLHILRALSDFDSTGWCQICCWLHLKLWDAVGTFQGWILGGLSIMQWCHWSLCWHNSVGVCNFLLLAIQLNICILYLWITIRANLPTEVTVDIMARLRQIPNKNGCWFMILTCLKR